MFLARYLFRYAATIFAGSFTITPVIEALSLGKAGFYEAVLVAATGAIIYLGCIAIKDMKE